MIFYVLAMEIRKEIWSRRVRCVGSLVLMLKVSSDRSMMLLNCKHSQELLAQFYLVILISNTFNGIYLP